MSVTNQLVVIVLGGIALALLGKWLLEVLYRGINREIKGRVTNHEVKYQNGGTNKTQRRKREARQEERSRNATSRRASDPAAHGW